ncbi:MAG: hypothetical protein HUU50_16320 [Candidatus Brocadiae bacterium]|nr:hypothetical protein [Candidatus Brocadiia bacterium]
MKHVVSNKNNDIIALLSQWDSYEKELALQYDEIKKRKATLEQECETLRKEIEGMEKILVELRQIYLSLETLVTYE